MRKAARGAAAQRQSDAGARGGRLCLRRRLGGAIAAAAHAREKSFEYQSEVPFAPIFEPAATVDKHSRPVW
jgi:hypothetical protein